MQRTAVSKSRSNAAFNKTYAEIWFNGTAPKPRVPLSSSTQGVDNPSRLGRIMRSGKSVPATRTVHATQFQSGPIATLATLSYSGHTFLPTRIERKAASGAYVRTTTPFGNAVFSRPTAAVSAYSPASLEIRSPRPTRDYNTAEFMLDGKYASQISDIKWEDYPPRNHLPYQTQRLSPLSSDPAWPTSSFALSIPSLGIFPSPVPERDPMAALLNFNSLSQPRPFAATNTFQFDPFGDDGPLTPVSDSSSSSSSSPTSGGSPASEWGTFNSPTASTTSLESNAAVDVTQHQDVLRDAVHISSLLLALDERKSKMDPEEYKVETAKIFALWNEAYKKVKQAVDAGA